MWSYGMLKLQIAFGSWPWVTAGLLITQNKTYIWTPLIIIKIDFEFFSYKTAAADVVERQIFWYHNLCFSVSILLPIYVKLKTKSLESY